MKQPFAGQLRLEPATDLHTHTTCSDGNLSPHDLMRKACDYQISVLGICDHDTTDALDTAIGISVHTPVDVLPGCELTCAEAGREYHLLAYCFEPSEDSFQRHLSRTRERRVRRCETMLERLRGEGVELSMDDVVSQAGGASIVRPHIAQALVAKGYVSSTQEAFDRYLSNHGAVYVPIEDQTIDEAIRVIHDAGGIA
ncbi:MAG: PHP domain-containing protein, partial [Candidatus Kapaibacterium sp.]